MILVVDDHMEIVAFLCRFLRRTGYDATCAADGHEALKIMETLTPDLVILDVLMPYMDGMDVLRAMRNDERLRAVPVVVFSVGHEKAKYDEAMKLGASAFMVKGAVGIPDLQAEIARHASPTLPAAPAA